VGIFRINATCLSGLLRGAVKWLLSVLDVTKRHRLLHAIPSFSFLAIEQSGALASWLRRIAHSNAQDEFSIHLMCLGWDSITVSAALRPPLGLPLS
jgi:hypothetical protein